MGVATVLVAAAACQGTDEGVEDLRDERGTDILAHLAALPAAGVVQVDDDAIPRFVVGDLGKVEVADHVEETRLDGALAAIAPVFRADAGELVLRRARTDEQGDQHFRLRQVKNGLPVIGAEIVLHVRDGVIIAANGGARSDLPAPEAATIDAADALSAARDGTDAVDVTVGGEAPLAYHASGKELSLVYQVEVTGSLEDGTPMRDTVLVDAVDGSIKLRMPHIHTAQNRRVHNLNHSTSLPGPIARTEGQAATGEVTVDTNYNWLGQVYQCYSVLFGRDSFDNAGATLISSVHYSTNYVNAFWDGTQMVYGDGDNVTASNLAHSMDVTAHELTHAVTDRESDLIYSGESGGLNEAMSDIFGNVCELFRDCGGNLNCAPSANTWLVGDDCWTPGTPGDALRYMADPSLDGSSLDFYDDSAGSVDVHYNSGIANLAFYLLSQGGTHPQGKSSVSVTGIGILKAAHVFYKANVDILTPSSSFEDAKTATVQAATQLGYTAAEIDSVTKAWQAVGVPAPPPVVTPLSNNVPVSNLSGSTGNKKYYALDVPAGATNLVFQISGGSGDADLYTRFGSVPTMSSWECRPYLGGNAETCTVASPQAGTYYVMLHAYSSYSGVTLKGSYTGGGGGPGTGHLVINEIDYDNAGTDSNEYVEIYNPTGSAVSLAGYSLVFINGANNGAYLTVNLGSAGTLNAGQYLVVGSSTVSPAAGALKINLAAAADSIQNGAPDGVALVSGSTVVDKLSYEGSVTAANIPGVGIVSLVEGTAFTTGDVNNKTRSLCRSPNGGDTDNASADWNICAALTPGSSN